MSRVNSDLAGLLPRVSSMVFNRPMMMADFKLAEIASVLSKYRGVDIGSSDLTMLRSEHGVAESKIEGGYEIVDGLALIAVEGTLLHKTSGLDALSGLMSYKSIGANLDSALGSNNVEQIAFVFGSLGGSPEGVFDLAEEIYLSRDIKPISAIIDEQAASAAYLLAAATSEIYIPQTGVAGSVGVVARLENVTKLIEKMGIDVEYIYSGSKKIIGAPDVPMSDDDRSEIRSGVAELYAKFVDSIVRYRGMSAVDVRGTEAGMFMGPAAIKIGFADRSMSVNDAIKTLVKKHRSSKSMTTSSNPESNQTLHTQEAADTLLASAVTKARAEGVTEGIKTGMEAEQKRVSSILGLENTSKNIALVHKCLSNPKLDADDVTALLSSLPEVATIELATVGGDQLAIEMSKLPNPDVGAASGDDDASSMDSVALRIINSDKV